MTKRITSIVYVATTKDHALNRDEAIFLAPKGCSFMTINYADGSEEDLSVDELSKASIIAERKGTNASS